MLDKPAQRGELYRLLPDGRWAIFVDHHLIDSYNKCEEYFRLSHIEHHRGKGKGLAMWAGIWWSTTMENYYNRMILGASPSKVDILVDAAKAWQEHDMWTLRDSAPKQFEKFANKLTKLDLLKELGSNVAPLIDQFCDKLPAGAIQMAARYWDKYSEFDNQNWKIISAELGFGLRGEVVVGENDKVVVYYVGKPDLVVFIPGEDQLCPVDHKTVERIEGDIQRKYKPHPQTAGYIFACSVLAKSLGIDRPVSRCIINACARNEPSDEPRGGGKPKPRFLRVFPYYSGEEIEEWRKGIVLKATRLRHSIESNEWVRKESSCHLFAGCQFRGVCSVPASSRPIVLKSDFITVEPWAPYETEEQP